MIIDTFDGAKPRFLNRGKAPLSINPEHTPGFAVLMREANEGGLQTGEANGLNF